MDVPATGAMFRRFEELIKAFAGSEWDGEALAGFEGNSQSIATLSRALRQGKRSREELYRFIEHGFSKQLCGDTKLLPYQLLRLIFAATPRVSGQSPISLPPLWKPEDGFFTDPTLDPQALLQWVKQLGIAQVDWYNPPELELQGITFVPNDNVGDSLHRVTVQSHTLPGSEWTINAVESMLDAEPGKIRGDVSLAVSLILLKPEHFIPGELWIFSGNELRWKDTRELCFITVARVNSGDVCIHATLANAAWNGKHHRAIRIKKVLA